MAFGKNDAVIVRMPGVIEAIAQDTAEKKPVIKSPVDSAELGCAEPARVVSIRQ